MKLKVYIIKKQQLIWAAVILAIILIAAVLVITLRTKQTISTIGSTRIIKADITNDGKNDSIVVTSDEKTGKYKVDVVASDGHGYTLEPDPVIKTLGYNASWWPINVIVKDINNDKSPEVVLQSADGNGPVLHIYRFANGKMERLASGRYSIFGTIKTSKNKADIIALGSKKGNNINFTYLTTNSGKLVPNFAPTSLTLGKDTLSSLVSYIEKKDVEAANINMENKLISTITKGSFLDGTLLEAKYKKYDIPVECIYNIRTNTDNGDKELVSYRVKLSLTRYDDKNPEYKITDVDIID